MVDSDQCGDSVYMAPELLKSQLPLKQRLTPKVDIFSLGASLLEIASSMNLPQNGLLWQKLREGTDLKFSPSANRSAQLEQLITRMMEPDPASRPDIDEILLHPNVQAVLQKSDRRALNSTPHKATTPSKSSLESSKATLIISPSTVALEMQQQLLNEKITSS